MGEEGVIALASRVFGAAAPGAPRCLTGIGDDAAVLPPPPPGMVGLLTTDTLVEGTHFTRRDKPGQVGWKAMAVNISDIAAMGGVPRYAVLSLALPRDTPAAYVRALMDGIRRAADAFQATVVGGDTVGSPVLALAIAMTGCARPRDVCHRHGVPPGAVIAVTGSLGGSLRSGRHLTFVPRLAEAQWLVRHARPAAMMDVSDGIAFDGARMARASGVWLDIRAAALPRHAGCSVRAALCDGEDFELLCAFAPGTLSPALMRAYARRFKQPLAIVGVAHAGPPRITLDGAPMPRQGFDHFAPLR